MFDGDLDKLRFDETIDTTDYSEAKMIDRSCYLKTRLDSVYPF